MPIFNLCDIFSEAIYLHKTAFFIIQIQDWFASEAKMQLGWVTLAQL